MIKLEKQTDFFKLLNRIAYTMIDNPDAYELLKEIGVDQSQWPVPHNFHAKKALDELSTALKTKTIDQAQYMVRSNYGAILAPQLLHDFPSDSEELKLLYHFNLNAWKAAHVGEQLIKDKFNYELYLSRLEPPEAHSGFKTLREAFIPFIEKNEADIKSGQESITIIPDFPILSEQIGGFNPGRITIIAAQSGFGKTRLAVNLALSSIKIAPVFYYNMEMTEHDFTQLFMQAFTGFSYRQIKKGDYLLQPERTKEFYDYITLNKNVHFTDGRAFNIDRLTSSVLVHTKDHPFSLVVIDYDQKISSNTHSEEWMTVLRAIEKLENIAKQTNCHIIILAQGNDDGDAKSSKRAKQPASAFLSFLKDESNTFYIKAIKNRWGKQGVEVVVHVEQESGKITESHLKDDFVAEQANKPNHRDRMNYNGTNNQQKKTTPISPYKD